MIHVMTGRRPFLALAALAALSAAQPAVSCVLACVFRVHAAPPAHELHTPAHQPCHSGSVTASSVTPVGVLGPMTAPVPDLEVATVVSVEQLPTQVPMPATTFPEQREPPPRV